MASKKIFMLSLLLVLHFPSYSSIDILKANQTFKEGDLLVSRNNKFAFGFFTPGSSSYRYLGIWFHNNSKPSVLWVANRNHPINGSTGFLSINQHRNLVHNDPVHKLLLWSTNVSGETSGPRVAQLLDSGNLALHQGRNRRILWKSFDYPTDTCIPGYKPRSPRDWNLRDASGGCISKRGIFINVQTRRRVSVSQRYQVPRHFIPILVAYEYESFGVQTTMLEELFLHCIRKY